MVEPLSDKVNDSRALAAVAATVSVRANCWHETAEIHVVHSALAAAAFLDLVLPSLPVLKTEVGASWMCCSELTLTR